MHTHVVCTDMFTHACRPVFAYAFTCLYAQGHTHSPAYTHICTRIHIRHLAHSFTYTCTHACMHAHTLTCMQPCTHANTHKHPNTRTHMHAHTNMHTCTHLYTHACVHAHAHTQTHTQMYAHVHTHTAATYPGALCRTRAVHFQQHRPLPLRAGVLCLGRPASPAPRQPSPQPQLHSQTAPAGRRLTSWLSPSPGALCT